MKKIGFSTTIPVEIILAAGFLPVDLNNVFITNKIPVNLVNNSESMGFPRNTCSWIKGIYNISLKRKFDYLIAVVEGDCSFTRAMIDNLKFNKKKILTFSYPYDRNYDKLDTEINYLCRKLKISRKKAELKRIQLEKIRNKLKDLEQFTYIDNKVTSKENHLWLVSSSDFMSDTIKYERKLDSFLEQVKNRSSENRPIRIAYLGVPCIFPEFYDYIDTKKNAKIVYNEVASEFAMLNKSRDLTEQYLQYTYPYDINYRLKKIKTEIKKRRVNAIIHYTQCFCHRQIDDMVLRKSLSLPILTLEGDKPSKIPARIKLRIDAFLEMLD